MKDIERWKRDFALYIYQAEHLCLVAFACVDPTIVPEELVQDDGTMALEFGKTMPVPITDLVLDDDGFRGTFSFSRKPIFCAVPWTHVFQVLDRDTGHVLITPLPADGPKLPTPTKGPRGGLRLVK